jgi:hypothetical protein
MDTLTLLLLAFAVFLLMRKDKTVENYGVQYGDQWGRDNAYEGKLPYSKYNGDPYDARNYCGGLPLPQLCNANPDLIMNGDNLSYSYNKCCGAYGNDPKKCSGEKPPYYKLANYTDESVAKNSIPAAIMNYERQDQLRCPKANYPVPSVRGADVIQSADYARKGCDFAPQPYN